VSYQPIAPPTTSVGEEPLHTPFGARLRERTLPLAADDDQYGFAHAHLCEALARGSQQLQEVFDPVDAAPFETMLDPARCPGWALPWLAQLVGLSLPTTITEEQARGVITDLARHKRGSTAWLRATAARFLTGAARVYFRERDATGGVDRAYTLEVVTVDDETPDPEAVRAALEAALPAGIVLHYRTVTSWDYQLLTSTALEEGWTYVELGEYFATYADLGNNEQIGGS
jgi:Phage tail protein (Tail_P2_I)